MSPTQQALQAYLTGSIANRRSKLLQRRPTSIQRVPHAMGTFRKEDLRPSPRNGLASSPHQRFVASGPFQGQQQRTVVLARECIDGKTIKITNINYTLAKLPLCLMALRPTVCLWRHTVGMNTKLYALKWAAWSDSWSGHLTSSLFRVPLPWIKSQFSNYSSW
jgi:hypothetical protein